MEDVNSLLNSGTLPNLWASDELESIVTSMRPVLKEKVFLTIVTCASSNFCSGRETICT